MDRPFSTGPFEYRRERMQKRIVDNNSVPLNGDNQYCLVVNATPAGVDQVSITYGFVMPDDHRKYIQDKAIAGKLDTYNQVILNYQQMDVLTAWWNQRRKEGK